MIDVSVPTQPRLVATLATPGDARGLVVAGGRAYIANGADGLRIVDVSNPAAPILLGSYTENGAVARSVDVQNSIAVLGATAGVRVIDVSNAGAPQLLGSIATTDPRSIRLRGTVAYVADYTGSLRLIDIAVPSAPRIVASTPSASGGYLNERSTHRVYRPTGDSARPRPARLSVSR